jgi:hypothetical protein
MRSARSFFALLFILVATAPAIAGEHAALYEEDADNPTGKRYSGTINWHSNPVKSADGHDDVAVQADIDIPDRKLKATMLFRRNSDPAFPASHTIELTFSVPPDFAGGGVGSVPGYMLKPKEQSKGSPLAASTAKVMDGVFLTALYGNDGDRQRNLQLLEQSAWFDIPVFYTNQHRAILTIEKGASGQAAFQAAFDAWYRLSSASKP